MQRPALLHQSLNGEEMEVLYPEERKLLMGICTLPNSNLPGKEVPTLAQLTTLSLRTQNKLKLMYLVRSLFIRNTYCIQLMVQFGNFVVRPQIVPRTEPTPTTGRLPDADVTGYAGHAIKMVEGRRLTIDVEATGTPTPSIKWRLPSGDRIGRGQSVGRASVLANDSLVISDTQPSDNGPYRPIASNAAGLAKVKARVTVVGRCDHSFCLYRAFSFLLCCYRIS